MQNTVKHFIRQHQLSCSVQSRINNLYVFNFMMRLFFYFFFITF